MSSPFSFDDLDSYIDEQIEIRENLIIHHEQYGGAVTYGLENSKSLLDICCDYGIDTENISLSI